MSDLKLSASVTTGPAGALKSRQRRPWPGCADGRRGPGADDGQDADPGSALVARVPEAAEVVPASTHPGGGGGGEAQADKREAGEDDRGQIGSARVCAKSGDEQKEGGGSGKAEAGGVGIFFGSLHW